MKPTAPSQPEVCAAARELGRRPNELTSVKLPGPGRLGESVLTWGGMPSVSGLEEPVKGTLEWEREDGSVEKRSTASYDSGDGRFLVASHESGPEIFLEAMQAGAAAVALPAGVRELIELVRCRRRNSGADKEWVFVRVVRSEYDEQGRIVRQEVLEGGRSTS